MTFNSYNIFIKFLYTYLIGYPCRTTPIPIITPFKNPHSIDQKRFNAAHSRARIVVECAFGILKTKWRNIFNRDLELTTENCIKTIFAAFVLHNICILKNDFNPNMLFENEHINDDDDDNEINGDIIVPDSEEGLNIRNDIFNDFLSRNQIL